MLFSLVVSKVSFIILEVTSWFELRLIQLKNLFVFFIFPIQQIFGSYFEILNHSEFEALYREASLESKDGIVSVERFKKFLDRRFNYGCLSPLIF